MKNQHMIFFFLLFLGCLAGGCSKGNPSPEPPAIGKEQYVRDLNNGTSVTGRPEGNAAPIYFSLQENKVMQKDDNWDIAFSGLANTQIISNSKANVWMEVLNSPYEKSQSKPSLPFNQSTSGNVAYGEQGWYIYDVLTHVISPVKGKTIFVKTGNNRVFKIMMVSIYQGAPEFPTKEDPVTFLHFKYQELFS